MCPSGLRSTLGKRVGSQGSRRFESSHFRHPKYLSTLDPSLQASRDFLLTNTWGPAQPAVGNRGNRKE